MSNEQNDVAWSDSDDILLAQVVEKCRQLDMFNV